MARAFPKKNVTAHKVTSDDLEVDGGTLSVDETNNRVGVGTITPSTALDVAGDVTLSGDIIIDDGGSLKEAGGTAAITFDGSGNVTKIGQDTPSSDEVLTWDGSKWVASAAAGGSVDLNGLSAGTIDVSADSFGFIDANDSNNSKKESIADFVAAIAGTNLTASNGVLAASGGGGGSAVDDDQNILAVQVFT
jgi:ethanolamine utilization microcompartment shell protein EutS